MPELPDVELYVERLRERTLGAELCAVRIGNPFLLRSVEPPLAALTSRRVQDVRRIGKRIAIGLDGAYWLVLHLMIAGRLQWLDARPALGSRQRLAAFDFSTGTLLLTEAGSRKRASLNVVHGDAALAAQDPGGLEPLQCSYDEFRAALKDGNRTLKRALTDPRRLSGIGNAYSDEILHAARLSPLQQTGRLSADECRQLYDAVRSVLDWWRRQLAAECGAAFAGKVTAFRPQMAVHGRYGKPCPECGTPVARIRYKARETNYCPGCQTGGRRYADRALSRLLKDGWPGD